MNQKIISLFVIIVVSFSLHCKPEIVLKIRKPDLFLTENQMVRLFVDAQLTEGALTLKRNKGNIIKEIKNAYYEKVFINNGVTEKVFEENIAYYNQFPEQMEKIYDEVLAELSKKQSIMDVTSPED